MPALSLWREGERRERERFPSLEGIERNKYRSKTCKPVYLIGTKHLILMLHLQKALKPTSIIRAVTGLCTPTECRGPASCCLNLKHSPPQPNGVGERYSPPWLGPQWIGLDRLNQRYQSGTTLSYPKVPIQFSSSPQSGRKPWRQGTHGKEEKGSGVGVGWPMGLIYDLLTNQKATNWPRGATTAAPKGWPWGNHGTPWDWRRRDSWASCPLTPDSRCED